MQAPQLDGPIRLPLSVGIGALESWCRAILGLGTIGVLAGFIAWVDVFSDLVPFVMGALAALFILLFIIFVAQNTRRALERGASDVLLDQRGISVSGGRADGLSLPWSELQAPGASVEQLEDKRVTITGMMGSIALGSLALMVSGRNDVQGPSAEDIDPNSDVGKWVLTLHGIVPKVVAETDDASEARSFKSARSSIASLVEGRTEVANQPAVARDFLACPQCEAPQVLQDAASLACPYCGATVEVSEAFRAQARSVTALGESFERTRSTVARLREQPLGQQVALVTHAIVVLMLLGFVGSWWMASRIQGQLGVLLFPLPFAIVGLAYSLTRAWLAGRAALRMLSLGYGALAPTQSGQAARCRRCFGPLAQSPAGAVVRCGYCSTDNVMGIDLRPVVHATRSAEETLEPMLQHLARERRTAFVITGITLGLSAVWVASTLS